MKKSISAYLPTLLCCLFAWQAHGLADKFRVSWQDDPSSTAVIIWNQTSGTGPLLYLDINDYGQKFENYAVVRRPDHVVAAKGMNNHFVRLRGLRPNTTYYFLIKDSEGISQRLHFTAAPASRNERLSIIAGGDSRNYREARQNANRLVGKLRPHCVMFGGDFTAGDTAQEWAEWFDDWQLSFSRDGRITPIIVARGNHEESNQPLIDLFGLRNPSGYYGLTLGGDLLRIYSLNTMMPAGGDQAEWLQDDLRANSKIAWKIAHYHHPMRPHTAKKAERNDQVVFWGPLFQKYGMNLAVECDAHVVKATWPIRPDNGQGSSEGFVRDDLSGTVYIGEGCWGAPLRENNDDKPWTRASSSFNQFHWIFVDKDKIEVRFIKTDGAEQVGEVSPRNVFVAPVGLVTWSPPNGDVVTLSRFGAAVPEKEKELLAGHEPKRPSSQQHQADETGNWDACPLLMADPAAGNVKIKYMLEEFGPVVIRLINPRIQEVGRLELTNQQPGEYLKEVSLSHLPVGRYLIIVRGKNGLLRRYRVMKPGQ